MATSAQPIKLAGYIQSRVHHAVATGDHAALSKIVSTVPRLADPRAVRTEADSLVQEKVSEEISAILDNRDVPSRETALHLAVRLNDKVAVRALAGAGADVSLQNAAGWNPLQEALCHCNSELALLLLHFHHRSAWEKWTRRIPRFTAVLHRMRDFYMEIDFHFESSVIPFVGKMAPSDTYRIWKRDGNLRADTSLAGFDGFKIHRSDQSFLYLGDGDDGRRLPSGTFLVLDHRHRRIIDAFENARTPLHDSEAAELCSQTGVYRPGMDVTRAELVRKTNWRNQDKVECVGQWKARIYEVRNVVFSFRSRKVAAKNDVDAAGREQMPPLELDEDDDGFLVADNPSFGFHDQIRRSSSFVREETERVPIGRKSVDIIPSKTKVAMRPLPSVPQMKEKEYMKNLRPSIWLTEQFPLKTEELLPLLDILASKVKAVRRVRDFLTTKFPPSTFPVKIAIPVVPTVKLVVTFTKFVELQSSEQFYTPLSSPRSFIKGEGHASGSDQHSNGQCSSRLSSSSSSSLSPIQTNHHSSVGGDCRDIQNTDPFAIPQGYTWTNVDHRQIKVKKSTRRVDARNRTALR